MLVIKYSNLLVQYGQASHLDNRENKKVPSFEYIFLDFEITFFLFFFSALNIIVGLEDFYEMNLPSLERYEIWLLRKCFSDTNSILIV